jgi:hypothetical protein
LLIFTRLLQQKKIFNSKKYTKSNSMSFFTKIIIEFDFMNNPGLKAHAWLRCGQVFVTGGYNKSGFTEVAKFGMNIKRKN